MRARPRKSTELDTGTHGCGEWHEPSAMTPDLQMLGLDWPTNDPSAFPRQIKCHSLQEAFLIRPQKLPSHLTDSHSQMACTPPSTPPAPLQSRRPCPPSPGDREPKASIVRLVPGPQEPSGQRLPGWFSPC